MLKTRALDEAQAEYLDRLRYYRAIDRELARDFRTQFREQLARARRLPESFPRVTGIARFNVRRFSSSTAPKARLLEATPRQGASVALAITERAGVDA